MELEYDKVHLPDPRWIPDYVPAPPTMEERIAIRVAELQARKRLIKAERQELAQLLYDGPAARVLPRTDEVPF